jgi:hypothetical protein
MLIANFNGKCTYDYSIFVIFLSSHMYVKWSRIYVGIEFLDQQLISSSN